MVYICAETRICNSNAPAIWCDKDIGDAVMWVYVNLNTSTFKYNKNIQEQAGAELSQAQDS